MKRILIIFMSLALFSSCLKDGPGMSTKYQLVASFQYSGLKFNADSTFVNKGDTIGFGYGALNFLHSLEPKTLEHQGGFILSCLETPKSGSTEGLKNRYRAFVPLESYSDNVYAVFYQNEDASKMPQHDVEFAFKENGFCSMSGCYVANTVEVADFIRANFEVGDRLTLKATGYFKGEKTNSVEMNLADFSAQKDSIVSVWTTFDLSKLGSIDFVDFEMISSKPEIPTCFCMDNMVAQVEIEY